MKNTLIISALAFSFFACSNSKNNGALSADSSTYQDSIAKVQVLPQTELAKTLHSDASIVAIDVRTPAEVSEGYIAEADLFIDFNGANFETEMAQLDKSKTYVMYCRSGGRSGKAANYMVQNGFKMVYNLEGGVLSYNGILVK
jgi:rhodanese-related sulfurtransferase